jgi:hypothetical protein
MNRFKHLQIQLGRPEVRPPEQDEVRPQEGASLNIASALSFDSVPGLGMTQTEQDQIDRMSEAHLAMSISAGISAGAALAFAVVPDLYSKLGQAANAAAIGARSLGEIISGFATRDAIFASYERRKDDWVHQSNQLLDEMHHIDQQLLISEVQEKIAQKELDNTRKQIEQSRDVADFLQGKFSNQQLYAWMESQIANVHFQAFRLAHDMAKQAEAAFHFELEGSKTASDAPFIRPGYWDGLEKGLLAGEQLSHDLKRLDAAYTERNKRELEITKHVSLRQLDGTALANLRANGSCQFSIPELLYALDFPSHYFRRIKSISVSVPCVVGPYSSVSGTLRMTRSSIRRDTTGSVQQSYAAVTSIATSSAQNDAGVFELNFRDERYLPFEGAGAASAWTFELPKEFPAFDYSTISDLVVHMRYTARDGGATFAEVASKEVRGWLESITAEGPVSLVLSVRHDFAPTWSEMKNKASTLKPIQLTDDLFPYFVRGRLKIFPAVLAYGLTESSQPTSTNLVATSDSAKFWSIDLGLLSGDFAKLRDLYVVVRFGVATVQIQ